MRRIVLVLACLTQWSFGSSCEGVWSDFDPQVELEEWIDLEMRIETVAGNPRSLPEEIGAALMEPYEDSVVFKVLRFENLAAAFYGLAIDEENRAFLLTHVSFSPDLPHSLRRQAQQLMRADMIRELQAKRLESIVAGVLASDTISRADLRSLGFAKAYAFSDQNLTRFVYTFVH